MSWLRVVDAGELTARRAPVSGEALAQAATIVEAVREGGEGALRAEAERFGDLGPGEPLVRSREELDDALRSLPAEDRGVLERTAARIERFARAQQGCLSPLDTEIQGGRAGHRWLPVESAGCYAPGGRYPLPSSVLMTVIPARVAGVRSVVVASPRPGPVTLAAAAVAGADSLLAVGGAQAIAALAFGTVTQAADLIVGPGNRFVTAAKKYLVGEVGIDGLAGPSELLVLADGSASPALVAADLLAQAEHDVDAQAILVSTSEALVDAVEEELERQLAVLDTADTAAESLRRNGLSVCVRTLEDAAELANRLAPEHLALHVTDPAELSELCTAYGGLFLGGSSAEVFGDYGAGPNHVLPTGGGARFQAGLSVATFLRPATWLEIETTAELVEDVTRLAELEGLSAHGESAHIRSGLPGNATMKRP